MKAAQHVRGFYRPCKSRLDQKKYVNYRQEWKERKEISRESSHIQCFTEVFVGLEAFYCFMLQLQSPVFFFNGDFMCKSNIK